MSVVSIGFYGVLMALGVLAIWAAARNYSQIRSLQKATSKNTKDLVSGESEVLVEGQVRATDKSNVFEEPFDGDDAVAYKYKIEREKKHEDEASGTYETVEKESERTEFILEDETGQVYVDPENAQLSLDQESRLSLKQGTSLAQRLNPARFGWETFTYVISGQSLKVDEQVSVLGTVSSKTKNGDPLFANGDGNYLISDANPKKTLKRMLIQSLIFGVIGIGFVLGFGYLLITSV